MFLFTIIFFLLKIIKKFTGSDLYSVIGSFFFLISPIFIYRVDEHVALASQWLLLFTLYLGLTQKIDKGKIIMDSSHYSVIVNKFIFRCNGGNSLFIIENI